MNKPYDEMVRIRYWQQDTMETGRWVFTNVITKACAERILKDHADILQRATIEKEQYSYK